jgi:arylsulfatase A-like enzyme
LAGVGPPLPMQGRSLVPIFQRSPGEWRSSFLIEYFSDTVFPRIRNMGYAATRTERYKYIEYRELQDMNELYDLETDPFEEHNLVGTPSARRVYDRMRSELQRLRAETGDKAASSPSSSSTSAGPKLARRG